MKFLKKLFNQDAKPFTPDDFWAWFVKHEATFFNVIKAHDDIETDFFNKLAPKLNQYKDEIFYLCGMYEDDVAELILTPDGNVKNIVFVEELIAAAPSLPNWRFTALKPAHDMGSDYMQMAGYKFGLDNLSYYAINHDDYPDEVDMVIVYDDYKEADKDVITNAVYICLDNYLGELKAITSIDNLTVVSREDAQKEPAPLKNLPAYLEARELSFIEKYEGTRYDTEEDGHSVLEAELQNGNPLVAVVNTDVLSWDSKASHPWILEIVLKYDGSDFNGLPKPEIRDQLHAFEDDVMAKLKDADGYLNIGRESANNERVIYFACKEFRVPSKVVHDTIQKHQYEVEAEYFIYKDKYWQSLNKFKAGE